MDMCCCLMAADIDIFHSLYNTRYPLTAYIFYPTDMNTRLGNYWNKLPSINIKEFFEGLKISFKKLSQQVSILRH